MLTSLKGVKILVTGGGGFLGRHLLPVLSRAGAEVSCLYRTAPPKMSADITAIRGDCLDASDVARAAAGQDIVIHMAGLLFGRDWQDYIKANAIMAGNIAAASSGKKVVFVSSLAASGPSALPKKESEPEAPVSAYGWSKYMAEQILQKSCANLAILRPPIIYGSGDRGLLPLFRSCGKGIGITSGEFPLSLIHADDCADAIVALCGNEVKGIYHLSDGNIYNLKQLCIAMGTAQGCGNVHVISTPKSVLKISAHLSGIFHGMASGICKLVGKDAPRPPSWNVDKLREALQVGWVCDNGKICNEPGFRPKMTLETGMAEAVAGYRREGLL